RRRARRQPRPGGRGRLDESGGPRLPAAAPHAHLPAHPAPLPPLPEPPRPASSARPAARASPARPAGQPPRGRRPRRPALPGRSSGPSGSGRVDRDRVPRRRLEPARRPDRGRAAFRTAGGRPRRNAVDARPGPAEVRRAACRAVPAPGRPRRGRGHRGGPAVATRSLSASVRIGRPPTAVFDWVADHRHVQQVMEGVREWRPIGRQATGVGARYRVEVDAVVVPLRAVLEIVEWERPRAIGWTTESSPVSNGGRWTFRRVKGGTEVELKVSYDPPAGAVGNFLASRVEGIVEERVLEALQKMRRKLEAGG